MIESGEDMLFTSRALLIELERVLAYRKLKKIMSDAQLSSADILRWVISHATIVIPKPLNSIIIHEDPSDDIVLACAVTAGAHIIITGDRHLLDLGSYKGVRIMKVSDYVKIS
jgi:putative PIN family toxin of toxin-antitoxin system